MKSLIIMLLFMAILSPEGFNQSQYITVEVDGLYSLKLPSYLEKTTELSTSASLQYKNLDKKLLVLGIHEAKPKNNNTEKGMLISEYYDQVAKQIAQKLDNAEIEKPSTKTLGNLNALQGGINGQFLDTPLRYILEVVESETHFYQIICWTEVRALGDISYDIHVIINSFNEIESH